MEILNLFEVALMPILKTLIVAIVGLLLAADRVNLLSSDATHYLNNLVFYLFFPALLAGNLINSTTGTEILSLWFTPVSTILTFIIGSALGWILVKIIKTPRRLHGLVIGCCAGGNLANLPVIIIPAICAEKNNPFGDTSTCLVRGMNYVSLSMSLGAFFIWSYVYNIIKALGTKDAIGMSSTIREQQSASSSNTIVDSRREALLPEYVRQTTEDETPDKFSMLKKIKLRASTLAEELNLKVLLTPPTIATIIGLIIGVITPLQKILVGQNAPLRVIESAIALLGEAAVPSMTLIMGANLLRGFKRSGASPGLVVGILIVRFIVLPIVGILVIRAAQHFGLVGSDPLYHFVLLLQYAVPPAMAIGTITQLFGISETECSIIMFWNYLVASIAMTLWSTYFMWILS